jgi:cobalt-zinc-cadmium efflux system membrane fusion protein
MSPAKSIDGGGDIPLETTATTREAHVGAPASKPASKIKDPRTCQTHALRVQFASAQSVRKAGVKVGAVAERPMTAIISAVAEADYDRERFAQISSPLAGRAWRVEKQAGAQVKRGDVLALVDAADVGKAKAELLQSIASLDLRTKTLRRIRSSSESGFRTEAELQEAEAAVQEANIRVFNAKQALVNVGLGAGIDDLPASPDHRSVHFLGLNKDLASSLDAKTTTANLLPLLAPFDGVVVQKNVVTGEWVDPSKPLFAIADIGRMWVTADLSLAEARRVTLGQRVMFRPDGAADQVAVGEVTWVSTGVDEQTRTVKVRAAVTNVSHQLLAHTFGSVQITIRERPTAVAIPDEALQWEGCCHIVFVRLTDDIFQVRKVKLGAKANGFTEVMIGLLPGEVVATGGSHVLKSEILKSALGAGCCVE